MRFLTAIAACSAAALVSAAPLEERQAPAKFSVFFGPGTAPDDQILFVDGEAVAKPAPGYYNHSEPLILTEDFFFTSIYNAPTGGQALIVNIAQSTNIDFTVPHTGYVIPPGWTHTGFSIINNQIAVNGSTTSFWRCLKFAAPGGSYPLYANEPVDEHALHEGACTNTVLEVVPYVG